MLWTCFSCLLASITSQHSIKVLIYIISILERYFYFIFFLIIFFFQIKVLNQNSCWKCWFLFVFLFFMTKLAFFLMLWGFFFPFPIDLMISYHICLSTSYTFWKLNFYIKIAVRNVKFLFCEVFLVKIKILVCFDVLSLFSISYKS